MNIIGIKGENRNMAENDGSTYLKFESTQKTSQRKIEALKKWCDMIVLHVDVTDDIRYLLVYEDDVRAVDVLSYDWIS